MTAVDNLNINGSNLATGKAFLVSDSTNQISPMTQTAIINTKSGNGAIRRVDFNHTELCTDCNPVTCTVDGERVPVGTWRDLLMTLVSEFTAKKPEKIKELYNRPLFTGSTRPFLLKDKPSGAARQTATGQWVYVNLNISALVDLIGNLCQHCGTSLDNVEITYAPKLNRGNSDIQRGRNSGSLVYTQQTVRAGFREWIVKLHPDWSYNTVTMHISDAYYLYNNDRGITLSEALTDDNGIQKAYDAVLHYFQKNPTQIQPSVRATGYRQSLIMLKKFLDENLPELLTENSNPVAIIPESVFNILHTDYANGFRFEATALRLLSNKTGIDIDNVLQSELKQTLFRRGDDVYFLLDVVTALETRNDIVNFADALLDEYGCFEIAELYMLYVDKLNPKCIGTADDFEKLYECISIRDIRCVAAPQIGNKIVRYSNSNVWGLFGMIAKKIIAITNDEFGGVISEDDLRKKFCAFSTDLLAKIIRNCVGNELLRVEISGITCYQTLDALGLPCDFSAILSETLFRLDDLGLTANEEVLHTTLSLALGVNFKTEYNIPNQATYRRLIDIYYKSETPREWKQGVFGEVVSS